MRSLSFLAGLGLIAVATQSSVAVYDDVLFSAHMVQHVLLIMVAPPLVFGRPVTLLMHSAGNGAWPGKADRPLARRGGHLAGGHYGRVCGRGGDTHAAGHGPGHAQ